MIDIMTSENKGFATWLENKYLDWQRAEGERKTLDEFADWLGFSRPLISHYMSGRRTPKLKTARQIASKLGNEIYSVLGFQNPDPEAQFFSRNWDDLSEEDREKILKQVEEGTGKPRPKGE